VLAARQTERMAVGTSHVLWASIAASAAVAAFVTLLIEYLAKPWLEVRKDRILETTRRRRAALHGLRRAAALEGRIRGLQQAQANQMLDRHEPNEIRHAQAYALIRDRIVRLAVEAGPLVAAAGEEMDAPAALNEDWHRSVGTVLGVTATLERDAWPDEQAWNLFGVAFHRLGGYAVLFATSRWRWWRRYKLIREIASLPTTGASAANEQQAAGTG
jgi:hypothetical protein